jgi:uncharacterized membrane protein
MHGGAMTKNNFIYMLVALLAVLVVLPIANDLEIVSGQLSRDISFSCLLLIGVWSLRGSTMWFRVGMFLAVAGMLLNTLTIQTGKLSFLYATLITLMLFLILAILTALRQVLVSEEVSRNRLTGVFCIYLLLGTVWALAYAFVELTSPGSFRGIEPELSRGWNVEWIYFSFITLASLGYGDITPLSITARVLSYTEAIFGVFYMAVLVAGLVGIHMGQQNYK